MFIIEKCVITEDAVATYTRANAHLWIPAWSGNKSRLDKLSVDDAIQAFFKMTAKVRSVPYRLRTIGHAATLAAINTRDAARFKKLSIFAVGFYPQTQQAPTPQDIQPCLGAVAPQTAGTLAGACDTPAAQVRAVIDRVAMAMAHVVSTHGIQVRFNSNGRSGGAWLVTSATDGILSNAEIGITYSDKSQQLQLLVSNKFLSAEHFGNKPCSFTNKMDHCSAHDSIEQAIAMLREVTRAATPEEFDLLILI